MTVEGPICDTCTHREDGQIHIPFSGAGTNKVMLIGDSGWLNEASTTRVINGHTCGSPFSGPSGYFINRQLRRIGANRDDFLIANALWCRAKHLGWTDHPEKFPDAALALEHCRPYLDELINRMQPKALVPMGNVALKRVTGLTGIQSLQSYIVDTPYGIPAIPTFHPSAIMQGNQKLAGLWCYAVKRALSVAKGECEQPLQDGLNDLLLDPSPTELENYLSQFDLSSRAGNCDIETLGGEELEEPEEGEEDEDDKEYYLPSSYQITRIGFSFSPRSAFSVPWTEPYISICRRVWEQLGEVWFWNQAFDTSRLARQGWPRPKRIIDGMWLWHWHQSDLPKALEFAAPLILPLRTWKHLSTHNPSLYNALDNMIQYMLIARLIDIVKSENRWAGFERHCIKMTDQLERMSQHGVLIDKQAQQELKQSLQADQQAIQAEIDTGIPAGVRKVKRWSQQPKPSQSFTAEEISRATMRITGTKTLKSGETKPICEWSLELSFNPGSTEQVKDLIRALKLPVPKEKGKETTSAKKLRVLERKNKIFGLIRRYRECSKLINSYMWPTGQDGRVHPQFGFHPSTWRKSARDPNIQTIPKRNDLAKKFRRLIVAPPGHLLGECDSSAIEAVLVGYYAQSPSYIELARKGVHKWLAEQYAGRPVSKEEPLYDKIKRVVHLSNYLGTPQRILDEYPDDFNSLKEARELQEFYFSTDAGKDIRRWQQSTMERAHKEHYLQTPFGQRHYFYDVFTYSDSQWKMGSDAKRAVAFMPQASASALQDIYLQKFCGLYPNYLDMFIAAVHDSLIAEIPEHMANDFMSKLRDVMISPIPELGGLWIGAEAKLGHNLGDMTSL